MAELETCPLCLGLPQAASHFDAEHWKVVEEAARGRYLEAQAEMYEARRHRRILAKQAPQP